MYSKATRAIRRPPVHVHRRTEPVRPAGVLVAARMDRQGQPERQSRDVEPERALLTAGDGGSRARRVREPLVTQSGATPAVQIGPICAAWINIAGWAMTCSFQQTL